MSHTLAAVFDNRADAERARDALTAAGIGGNSVRLNAASTGTSTTTTPGASTMSPSATHDESIGDSIKHFFSNLFGDDDERVVYGEAVNRGNVVLTVQADTQDEIERAADIVEGFGPSISTSTSRSGRPAAGAVPRRCVRAAARNCRHRARARTCRTAAPCCRVPSRACPAAARCSAPRWTSRSSPSCRKS
ncbi:hypothetical protein [Pseudoduganella armeniaca]|uniref:Uncharacterized protein n=1 Tax=Pseudoduganella armeniaca TaxID=2072590 RepID=A0A2R4C916_9BURK|nr:hypothetical protein [Pseudoduganella armeniaca]AVR96032.1 hypothetical protein C9I28_10055 [Pseudoduganella armeniaca]